jgi:hypothetical protein
MDLHRFINRLHEAIDEENKAIIIDNIYKPYQNKIEQYN